MITINNVEMKGGSEFFLVEQLLSFHWFGIWILTSGATLFMVCIFCNSDAIYNEHVTLYSSLIVTVRVHFLSSIQTMHQRNSQKNIDNFVLLIKPSLIISPTVWVLLLKNMAKRLFLTYPLIKQLWILSAQFAWLRCKQIQKCTS